MVVSIPSWPCSLQEYQLEWYADNTLDQAQTTASDRLGCWTSAPMLENCTAL